MPPAENELKCDDSPKKLNLINILEQESISSV